MGNPIHVLKSPEEKEGIINCRYDLVAETAFYNKAFFLI